jgi:hypothetical protein
LRRRCDDYRRAEKVEAAGEALLLAAQSAHAAREDLTIGQTLEDAARVTLLFTR